MLNLLIINNNIDYCKSLLNFISENSTQTRVYSIASNLNEGINILNTKLIDIVLINLDCDIRTILDSFKNIEASYSEDYNKSFLIVSNNDINKITHKYIYDYISPSSKEMHIISSKINEIAEKKSLDINNSKLVNKINCELEYIGYNLSYIGTKYLCESIALIYNNYDNSENLKKSIYPILAKKHNKTINNIKCNITKATNAMFYDCEESRLKKYFSFYSITQPKPKLVIYTILNKLHSNI